MRNLYALVFAVMYLASITACTKDDNKTNNVLVEDAASFEKIGSLKIDGTAGIGAYDPSSMQLFVLDNANLPKIEVIDLARPDAMGVNTFIDFAEIGASVSSLAVKDGLLAVVVEEFMDGLEGHVMFYNTQDLALLADIRVGATPNRVVFSPNGEYVLVANEGKQSMGSLVNPEGSLTLIDTYSFLSEQLSFKTFNDQVNLLQEKGFMEIEANTTLAEDVEPGHIVFSPDSKMAYATLQAHGGIAVIDLASKRIVSIKPLQNFKPGAIDAFAYDNKNFLITTNEKMDGSDAENSNSFGIWNANYETSNNSNLDLVYAGSLKDGAVQLKPEQLSTGVIGNKLFAFMSLAQEGWVDVIDLSNPFALSVVSKFDVEKGVDNMLFIEAKDSPTGKSLLVTCRETSGEIEVFSPSKILPSEIFQK